MGGRGVLPTVNPLPASLPSSIFQVKVLHLSCAYGMVKQILALLVEQYGVELVEVPISADDFGSDAAVLAAVRRTIAGHGVHRLRHH